MYGTLQILKDNEKKKQQVLHYGSVFSAATASELQMSPEMMQKLMNGCQQAGYG
jgi:hypothetical protein